MNKQVFPAKLPELSDEVWDRIGPFIEREVGIRMPEDKRHMLQNRLLRRLRHLGLPTFEEYCDYLFSEEGQLNETTPFINEVTTNKTFFFREYRHFEFLSDKIIPAYLASPAAGREPFRVWSCGCSTGEEVYSIACIIEEFMRTEGVSFPYEIVGTDVSTRVLWHAHDAIYDADQIGMISKEVAYRYFLAGKEANTHLRRVIPAIRSRVKLRKLNLMNEAYPFTQPFDLIFCRNVLIYFSRDDIMKIVTRSLRHLKQGGHLITGHADSTYGAANQLRRVEPSIFVKARG
jgi:chemotaxis protein methyltransferase CheR